jgi:GNAT superfamily N-acetyltransferase
MILSHHPAAGWLIRPNQAGDSVPIVSIFETCLKAFPWRGPSHTYRRQMIRDMIHHEILVAEVSEAGVVGFMIFDPNAGYVSHLFVEADWRFCGIGGELLTLAREASDAPLTLDVDTLNTGAQAAYAALGWRETVSPNASNIPGGQIRLISP